MKKTSSPLSLSFLSLSSLYIFSKQGIKCNNKMLENNHISGKLIKVKHLKCLFFGLSLLLGGPLLAQEEPSIKAPDVEEMNGKAAIKIDPEVYSQRALQKTEELGTYLSIISDRSNSMAEANKAVDLAVKLFINEDAEVEVSGPDGRDRYKVRTYLNRLKLLDYDKVEISWTDISYVSDLKKGTDGNYYGIITLQQRFKGFRDNKVVYGDLTEKNIEVMVVPYQKSVNGVMEQKWDVFLSDIGVVVTKFGQ